MSAQKTIFISILSGVEAKNILRTDVLKKILEADNMRVVLFLKSKERVAFYQQEFNYPNLFYEAIATYQSSFLDRFLEMLKHYLVRTKTLLLYKQLMLADKKNYLSYFASRFISFVIGRKFFRRIARFVDENFIYDATFEPYFKKYNPDVIFLANLFDPQEISFLRTAKRRKIPTIGFINSWDKATSKGFIRLLPDKLLVPNELVKVDVLRLADAVDTSVFSVGFPERDSFANKNNILSKNDFFKKIGISLDKKLIVFSPAGTSLSGSDWQMIDVLHDVLEKDFSQASLFVRFPPNDFFESSAEIAKRPWLTYVIPGIRFATTRGMDWDMSSSEFIDLKNTLYHMDMLVSYATSLVIDAACFDKPIINIGFEMVGNESAFRTPTLRYKTSHYSNIIRTRGVWMAMNREELKTSLKTYLENPQLHQEGRRRIVSEQCGFFDGKAGERIAGFITSCMQ